MDLTAIDTAMCASLSPTRSVPGHAQRPVVRHKRLNGTAILCFEIIDDCGLLIRC